MEFNRLDICAAYYLFGMMYHSGQFSKEYAYIGRALKVGFKPGHSLTYERLNDNAKAIYRGLVKNNPAFN